MTVADALAALKRAVTSGDYVMNRAKFFDACRAGVMGPTLTAQEVSGTETVLDALDGLPLSWAAYGLGTAWHETAHTMQPVREAYWFSEDWRRKNLRYFPWYGRGYVQLTWKPNYERADEELGLGGTLVAKADRAMEPAIAADIMREGMTEGWFTGKRFASYLPKTGPALRDQFRAARRIINGTDKADLIAGYALGFQDALLAGGWK